MALASCGGNNSSKNQTDSVADSTASVAVDSSVAAAEDSVAAEGEEATPRVEEISIQTFCKYEQGGAECGRIISIIDSKAIIAKLKSAGFAVTNTKKETRNADYTGETNDLYKATITTLEGNGTVVEVDSDGEVDIKFATLEAYNKFLDGCKAMGYKLSGGYYTDGAKCHWAGSKLEVNSSKLTIEIERVWEA